MDRHHFITENKFNVLFLPGFPGSYRERKLTKDLVKLGFNIYSIEYPGIQKSGLFSPENVSNAILTAIMDLNETKLPLLIITYSFSSLFIHAHVNKVDNLMGIVHFSPIFDLSESIHPDFMHDLVNVSDSKWNIDIDSFRKFISETRVSREYVAKLTYDERFIPQVFAYGQNDDVIKKEIVHSQISVLRKNRKGVIEFIAQNGSHGLDSIYESGHVFKYIASIVFAYQISDLISNASVYLWGAQLNYRYSGPNSDIDLIVLGDNFSLDDMIDLNKLVNKVSDEYGVRFDIIVNTYDELMTKDRIRSNRGVSFVHELSYYYVPLFAHNKLVHSEVTHDDLLKDIEFAGALNLYRSHKAILNFKPGSDSSNWILKLFIIACYYDQYRKGNLAVDQNYIDQYYIEGTLERTLLDFIRETKKTLKAPSYADLKKIVEGQELLQSRYSKT